MKKDDLKKVLHEYLDEEDERKQPQKPKRPRTPLLIIIIICLLVFGLQYSTKLFQSADPEPAEPYGKILAPCAGDCTGCLVDVTGETRNLESG